MIKINTTLEVSPEQLNGLENFLIKHFTILDFRIVPDTKKLYQEDERFKNLCNEVKKAKKNRDDYYNLKRK